MELIKSWIEYDFNTHCLSHINTVVLNTSTLSIIRNRNTNIKRNICWSICFATLFFFHSSPTNFRCEEHRNEQKKTVSLKLQWKFQFSWNESISQNFATISLNKSNYSWNIFGYIQFCEMDILLPFKTHKLHYFFAVFTFILVIREMINLSYYVIFFVHSLTSILQSIKTTQPLEIFLRLSTFIH